MLSGDDEFAAYKVSLEADFKTLLDSLIDLGEFVNRLLQRNKLLISGESDQKFHYEIEGEIATAFNSILRDVAEAGSSLRTAERFTDMIVVFHHMGSVFEYWAKILDVSEKLIKFNNDKNGLIQ